jgi:hypothetical protein
VGLLGEGALSASDQSVRRALAPLLHQTKKHTAAVLMHAHPPPTQQP